MKKNILDISELILYKPGFIKKEDCKVLIDYYEENKDSSEREHCPEAATNVDTWSTFDRINVPCGSPPYKIVSDDITNLINLYHNYTDKFKMFHAMRRESMLYSHMIRLMKYGTGAKIHPHSDHNPYVYGSCTFNLNDDYEGGEFVFFRGKLKYKLKRGDALIFPADYYWVHEVKPITKGVRYSVNCFLQCIPESVKADLCEEEAKRMENYIFNPKDGVEYKIKKK